MYRPELDFKIDKKPSVEIKKKVRLLVDELESDVLEQLDITTGLSVVFVSLNDGEKGEYVSGTIAEKPFIVIDAKNASKNVEEVILRCLADALVERDGLGESFKEQFISRYFNGSILTPSIFLKEIKDYQVVDDYDIEEDDVVIEGDMILDI